MSVQQFDTALEGEIIIESQTGKAVTHAAMEPQNQESENFSEP